LAERYPDCFTRDAKKVRPLAIGIQQKLRAELAEAAEFDGTPGWMVRQALAIYTRSLDYLNAIVEMRPRVNLDGSTAGEVTEQEQSHARTRVEEIMAARAARRPKRPNRPPRSRQANRSPRAGGQPKPRAVSHGSPPPAASPQPEETTQEKLQRLAAKFSRN
jgi:ProP effector